jgi:DNA-directed RNA polymerase subunit E'/Rpb7
MSSVTQAPSSKKATYKNKKGVGIYMKNVITRKIHLPFTSIGENIKENIEEFLRLQIAGKCIDEGYIRPNSIKIVSYSAGVIIGNQ